MSDVLSDEARDLGAVLAAAVDDAGGFELARRAERDPTERKRAEGLLDALDVWTIDPYADMAQLEAAAATCEAAGGWALPYPLAERLATPRTEEADAVAHVDPRAPRIPHGGLDLRWLACDGDRVAPVASEGEMLGTKLGPFVADVAVPAWSPDGDRRRLAMLMTLQAWTLRGMARAAASRTYRYVTERRQFGAPLASFQALRFALTDVEVHLEGLTETARYTLWSLHQERPEVWTDALALRLTALEATDAIFRICTQSHGAMGLCDESDLSWLSRHSQPLRRLPWGRSRTEAELLASFRDAPLSGPFTSAR